MKKFGIAIILITVMVTTIGCAEGNLTTKESQATEETSAIEANTATEETSTTEITQEQHNSETVVQTSEQAAEERGREIVEIYAHVKEIEDRTILLSSDTDLFPGAFSVEVPEDVTEVESIQAGESLRISMEDKHSKNAEGLPEYTAQSIVPGIVGGAYVSEDILPKEPPKISLTDALSSTINQFGLKAGSCEWNYTDGDSDTITSYCADSPVPLDGPMVEQMSVLSVPDYQGLEAVIYLMNCPVPPDYIILKEWAMEDAGTVDAEPLVTWNIYSPDYMLDIQKGRIYSLTAWWNESMLDTRGFYGTGEYLFKTE